MGPLDIVYHDSLERCRNTAKALNPEILHEDDQAGPWNMGPEFEGKAITDASLDNCRFYVRNAGIDPPGGEAFYLWYTLWMRWLNSLEYGYAAVGVVTHNRNIQAVYSTDRWGFFRPHMYDVVGPDYCTVHVYDQHTGEIAPWGGNDVPRGIYLIRHGETDFGT
jgi:broad specificity phosphatase PhoE